MKISRLHYISMESGQISHLQAIEKVCRAGADWVQLRVKNRTESEILDLAIQARQITMTYGSCLIVNDFVNIARQVHADGVHLGLDDMSPAEAREVLGNKMIIGGTANTFEDIQKQVSAGVDYLGVGPFRFTQTKDHLSPVLGAEGYKILIEKCRASGIDIPLIAIGGIQIEDVASLMETGVYGVAVAGSITKSSDIAAAVQNFNKQLAYG